MLPWNDHVKPEEKLKNKKKCGLMTAACNQLAISPRLRWSYFQVLQWAQTPVTIHFQSGATCDVHEESTPQKKTGPCVCRPWSRSHDLVNKKNKLDEHDPQDAEDESWVGWEKKFGNSLSERLKKKISKTVCCQADKYQFQRSNYHIPTTLFDLTGPLLSQIGGAHLYWSNRPSASSASTCPARR